MTARSGRAVRLGLAAALLAGGGAALAIWPAFGVDVPAAAAAARAFAALHPVLAAGGYSMAVVVVAALAIPVVAPMTVAAGALFGPWLGVPIAVASSVAGATLAMLLARYCLRDWVERRFPDLARRFHADGAGGTAFLLAARLTPVVPFALVNAAAGASRMPARTFAAVSAAGALPLAAVYVCAGATIGAARNPADLVSPRLFALLTLAAAATLLARAWIRLRGRPDSA